MKRNNSSNCGCVQFWSSCFKGYWKPCKLSENVLFQMRESNLYTGGYWEVINYYKPVGIDLAWSKSIINFCRWTIFRYVGELALLSIYLFFKTLLSRSWLLWSMVPENNINLNLMNSNEDFIIIIQVLYIILTLQHSFISRLRTHEESPISGTVRNWANAEINSAICPTFWNNKLGINF